MRSRRADFASEDPHAICQAHTVPLDVLRVDEGDDAVQRKQLAHILVDEERLRDGARVGHARGLDQDAIEPVPPPHQATEDTDQVTPNGAANAAVVHLEQLLVAGNHQLVIDADLAELVFNHREFLPVVLGQNPVEKRGFAGTQEAGEDGNGNHFGAEDGGRRTEDGGRRSGRI